MDEEDSGNLSVTEQIYPLCYKVKETCPPPPPCASKTEASNGSENDGHTVVLRPLDCVEQWSAYENAFSPRDKDQKMQELFDCLKKYGDMYAKLGMELYVDEKSKRIHFPDGTRIAAAFNEFLRNTSEQQWNTKSPKERDALDERLMMFNILSVEGLRKLYNEFYPSYGFAELSSLMPKEYGVARLLQGGKRKRNTRRGRTGTLVAGRRRKRSNRRRSSRRYRQ